MPTLEKIAQRLELDKQAAATAGKGGERLAEILEANQPKFRIPNWFSPIVTATNQRLANVEKRLNAKTLGLLRDAASSNKTMADLLEGLPAKEKQKLLAIINSPSTWKAITAGGTAAFAEPAREALTSENALAPQPPANALAAP